MKKIVAVLGVIFVAAGSHAASLFWGTDAAFGQSSGGDIYKSDGTLLENADGYHIYLFLNNAPTTEMLDNLGSAAITNTPFAAVTPVTQYLYDISSGTIENSFYDDRYRTPDTEGTYILTTVLSSDDITSTIAGAYDYVLFDSIDASQPLLPDPFFNYDLGTVSQGDWTAIPEPSTMLLGGIGLLGLWIRRRMSK
jgi:hypothetical protein